MSLSRPRVEEFEVVAESMAVDGLLQAGVRKMPAERLVRRCPVGTPNYPLQATHDVGDLLQRQGFLLEVQREEFRIFVDQNRSGLDRGRRNPSIG